MISWPFDSTVTEDTEGNPIYSRTYSSDVLATILRKYFNDGVFGDDSTEFQVVEASDMTVTVEPGHALIQGRHCYEESERTLTVQAANASLDRIDTVVLRLDLSTTALSIDLYIVEGTAAATPTQPDLTRNSTIWELGLANLYITRNVTTVTQDRITDTRLDSERCGVVASIVGDTDTSTWYAQIAADLASFKATQEADFNTWYATIQGVLGEDEGGNLLNLINEHAAKSYSISLPASGWSDSAPYTQTASLSDILSTDTPLADVVLSDTAATAQEQLDAYGYVGRIDTADGSVTATCYESKPSVDLTLALKVVR
jgi:hypothetical protein